MKILVFGPKARYDAYMPEFAPELGAELVFCPLGSSPRQAAADNPDTQVLFDPWAVRPARRRRTTRIPRCCLTIRL